MSTTETQMLRQALLVEVEKLPEDRLREVLDFVRFLIFKSTWQISKMEKPPDSQQNPFLKLIGSVDVEPFADNIDQELYTLPQQETALDTDQNPLLDFIGGVSHGRLAYNIDEELLSS